MPSVYEERNYGMSIKLKLSALIFAVVTTVLGLTLLVFYLYSSTQVQHAAEQQMAAAEDQLKYTLSPTLKIGYYLDLGLSERQRIASIAAKAILGPKSEKITPDKLDEVRLQLGMDGLTLIKEDHAGFSVFLSAGKDIQQDEPALFQSPEREIIQQLYDKQYVTLPGGISLRDFWAKTSAAKNGMRLLTSYYYDGSTDYIIRSVRQGGSLIAASPDEGSLTLDNSTLELRGLLEVSGFNLGLLPSNATPGAGSAGLRSHAPEFGTYKLAADEDYSFIHQAAQTQQTLLQNMKVGGREVLRGYIPFEVDSIRQYVMIVTLDKSAFKEEPRRQLILLSAISIVLLTITVVVSYWLAGVAVHNLRLVVRRVNQIAAGNFNYPITVRTRDEIGELAFSVNVMSSNLNTYTTRLKESAEELRSTKEYLESFFTHTRDAIHVYNLKGQLISANRAFEAMLGWQEDELTEDGIKQLPAEQLQDVERMIESVLLGVPWVDAETWMQTKDERRLDVSTTASPIRNQHGVVIAVACITRNVTSRKQTEELLRRTEKLTIVGQLAAGVAHEIRNPLTTLRGFVQMQLSGKPLSPYYLNIMLSELDRINFIVGEFLVLSKPQADRYQACDLRHMLEDMAALLEPEAILNNVSVHMDLDVGVPFVVCEPNQLKQVFVNIMKNGIEAMPERGGRLTVTLQQADDDLAEILIRDEGVGIPEEHLHRLGEPFYTNKETGNGLGLMVSQRIISNHGGSMFIRSTVGEGTEVVIRLPLQTGTKRLFPA